MKKAFSFAEPEEGSPPPVHEIEINSESFTLVDDIVGIELLKLAGDAATIAGVHRLLSRAIPDDDWERFIKRTNHCKLPDFYKIGAAVIDCYTENPTTAAADS